MGTKQEDGALRGLERMTAELGGDPTLSQGAGGNTSVKCGGTLWVKASGAWMRDAGERSIFVAAPALALREAAWEADEARIETITRSLASPHGLRPSIEASLHAVLPHTVVIHTHAINSVVCAALADGERRFGAAMAALGVAGRYVPYLKPGPTLAAAIARTVETEGAADVYLLQNHGIIVGGPDPERVADLLRRAERALAFPVRDLPAALGQSDDDAVFELALAHCGIARVPILCEALALGPLTPDQVVFLGGAPGLAAAGESLSEAALRIEGETGLAPALLYRPGRSAYQRTGLSEGQRAMSQALAEIAKRIPEGARLVTLTPEQSRELVDWEAERYRRAQDAARN